MGYAKSYFSRLNATKMKTSGSPGNPWMNCLFTVQPQEERGTIWGWEEGQERPNEGVCVQGLKETTSGKAASPSWPLPQQQISQSEQQLRLLFTSDEVEEPMRRRHNNPNHLVLPRGREVKGEKMH